MNKVLSILIYIIIFLFVATTLYVFEIPPLNPGGAIIPSDEQSEQSIETTELPEFLAEEKIGRAKTYTEHMNRAKLLNNNGYSSLAIAEYEAASKLSPSNPKPLVEIATVHLKNEDLIKAKLSLEAAIKINPDSLEAKILLTKTFIADRKINEAKGIIDSITIHNQESKYYKALLAAHTKDHGGAKNLFNEVINIGGNAELTKCAQNYLAAYNEFDSYQGASTAHLLTLLARSYNQTEEYELAIPLLFEVITDKKEYRDAWILLGYAYLSTEKYQDAIDALSEAQKLDPQKPETAFFLGLSYYGIEDYTRAAASLEIARNNGFEPRVQIDQKLADIYLKLKEYEKSAQSYEDVLSLNDKDINYFIKPIWIYIDRTNEPEKAVALAKKALKAHPYEAMSYNLAGWANISVNNFDEANKFLSKANAIDPNLDAVYLNFGKLFEKKGNKNEAIAYYKKAYEMGHGNSISEAAANEYNRIIGKETTNTPETLKADLLNQ